MASKTSRGTMILAMVVALAGSSIVAAPSAAAAPRCLGKRATIVGADNPRRFDELIGTPGPDVIVGLAGDDFIDGAGGDDLICGGDGFDLLRGAGGDDRLAGGAGLDDLFGGRGNDLLLGGRGMLDGLFGGAGDDRLFGGPGAFDQLMGGPDDDFVDGGSGLDVGLFFDSKKPIVADLRRGRARGHGSDKLRSVEGIMGSDFADVLRGDAGSNSIRGLRGADIIQTFDGVDVLEGSGGNDELDGGDGVDFVDFQDAPSGITADLSQGTATGWGADSLSSIETVVGSHLDDSLTGDEKDNAFAPSFGDDEVDGGPGVDEVAFFDSAFPVTADLGEGTATGWGDDTLVNFEDLTGSFFRDRLVGDDGPNLIWGGNGNDIIEGEDGDDLLLGVDGYDRLNGGAGDDTCDGEVAEACEHPAMAAHVNARGAASATFSRFAASPRWADLCSRSHLHDDSGRRNRTHGLMGGSMHRDVVTPVGCLGPTTTTRPGLAPSRPDREAQASAATQES